MDKVAVVILNYNGRQLLQKFLPSVTRFSENYPVFVVDNGSKDDSVSFVQENYPAIQLIVLGKNEGFCSGYNVALNQIEATYYILLNSDVEVTENWINPLLQLMEKNPKIAVCQPKIKSYRQKNYFEYAGAAGGFIDKYGYPFCRGRIFDTLEEDIGQYNDTKEIFWSTGACMFVRAEVFHQLGGLDEDFFAHMEEIDFCWRAKNAGHQIFYIGESSIYHVGGATLSVNNPRKTFLNFHNNLAMLYKNIPGNQINQILLVKSILDLIATVRFLILGYWWDSWAILRANFHFYRNLKKWKVKRRIYSSGTNHAEIYKKSIVFQYFVKRKNYYRDL